ncbi:MAG: hypothetical protein Fur003_0350 [Candidatus Dojkabacteria bacterium]
MVNPLKAIDPKVNKSLLSLFLLGTFLLISIVSLAYFALNGGLRTVEKSSANFPMGLSAVNGIGQIDWSQYPDYVPEYEGSFANGGTNPFGGGIALSVEVDPINHRLFVAENNNRILVYNLSSSNQITDRVADYVLGQDNFMMSSAPATSASRVSNVTSMAFDPTTNYLYVAQPTQNRVTVFDVQTITNNEPALYVIGQTLFSGITGATTQAGLNGPYGVALDVAGRRLFVSQTTAHRITVYDISTITNGEAAINVLGQLTFTTGTSAVTQAGLNSPYSIAYDSSTGYLYAAQNTVNRVTVFDTNSITDGEPAINVIGQALFTTSTTSVSQSGLSAPKGVEVSSGKLYIPQSNGNRITVFDISTITDGEPAINVLGQVDYTSSSVNTTQSTFRNLTDIMIDSSTNRLYAADYSNRRVMIFDIASITDGENAVDMVGQLDPSSFTDPQPDYTRNRINNLPNLLSLENPNGIEIDEVHHRLFLADSLNYRVLVFNLNSDNTMQDNLPDHILGSNSFGEGVSECSSDSFYMPNSLLYEPQSNYLFVGDYSRVLAFDVSEITNGEAAVKVLGRSSFDLCSGGGMTDIISASAMIFDSVRNYLFVADSSRCRVTVYDLTTFTSSEDPLYVLGQADFTQAVCNNSQNRLFYPNGLAFDSETKYLFVANSEAKNVLIFDTTEIVNGENAIHLLGQDSYTSTTSEIDQNTIPNPTTLLLDEERNYLYVGDLTPRILVFDITTITDSEPAVNVIGQNDYTSMDFIVSQSTVITPIDLAFDKLNNLLYVSDYDAHRVTVFDVTHFDLLVSETSGSTSVVEGGSGDTVNLALSRQPSSNVVINISANTSDQVALSTDTITFTTSNWSTPQTVTLTAVADDNLVAIDTVLTFSIDVNTSAAEYDEVSNKTVDVNVSDSSVAGVTVTPIDLITDEDIGMGSFSVTLTAIPSSNVVLSFSSSNVLEGTVESSITITPSNWNNASENIVLVTGVDDLIPTIDGDIKYIIQTGDVVSEDPSFDSLVGSNINDLEFTNEDNDGPEIIIKAKTTTQTSEAGEKVEVEFRLKTKIDDGKEVSVPLTISDNSEAKLDKSTITISSENWNSPEKNKVIITGLDDTLADGNVVYKLITGDPLSNDTSYDAIIAEDVDDISFINKDNDNPAILLSADVLEVVKGSKSSLSVKLASEPTKDVELILSDKASVLEFTPSTLIFTKLNWNEPQTVTISAALDVTSPEGVVQIIVAPGSDDAFLDLSQIILVTIVDKETEVPTKPQGNGSKEDNEGKGNTLSPFKLESIRKAWIAASTPQKVTSVIIAAGGTSVVGFSFYKVLMTIIAIVRKKKTLL